MVWATRSVFMDAIKSSRKTCVGRCGAKMCQVCSTEHYVNLLISELHTKRSGLFQPKTQGSDSIHSWMLNDAETSRTNPGGKDPKRPENDRVCRHPGSFCGSLGLTTGLSFRIAWVEVANCAGLELFFGVPTEDVLHTDVPEVTARGVIRVIV